MDSVATIATPQTNKLPKVLFVDDELPVLKAMMRFSRGRAWDVVVASSAELGLEYLQEQEIDIVVSDMRMPGMCGDEFLTRVKEKYPQVTRILLTGYSDIGALGNAINNAGIYNYINKPWDDNLLADVITGALRFQASERERERLEELTKKQNRQLGRLALSLDKTVKERTMETEQALTLLQMTHERAKNNFHDTLSVVTQLLDWNENRGNNHSRFVAEYATKVAQSLALSNDDIDTLKSAALLHDIGLMALPESQRKKSYYDLNEQELKDYRQHPILGEMALAAVPSLEPVAKIVRQHHEYLDGTGYPDGLHAKDISKLVRIITVVADYHDLYYGFLKKQCLGHEDAKAYLLKRAGLAYDESIVKCFLSVIGDNHLKIRQFKANCKQLKSGMILDEDLKGEGNLVLLTRGTIITPAIIDRLLTYELKFKMHFELNVRDES